MRKIDKIENEKLYTETIKQWLLNRGYYYPELDKFIVYDFMYYTFKLPWRKTKRLIKKNISKEILDKLEY